MTVNGLNCTGTIFILLFHAGKDPHTARQIASRQSSAQRFLAIKESRKERRGGIWATVLEATVVNGGGLAPTVPTPRTIQRVGYKTQRRRSESTKPALADTKALKGRSESKTPCLGDELRRYVAHTSLAKDA